MKLKFGRVLAVALVLCLALSLVPAAYAAEAIITDPAPADDPAPLNDPAPTGDPEPSYKISFDTNGGEAIEPMTVKNGEQYEFPSSALEGFSQEGWYTEDGTLYVKGGKPKEITGVTADFTLTMKRSLLKPTGRIVVDPAGSAPGQRTLSFSMTEASGIVYSYEWTKTEGEGSDAAKIIGTEKTLSIAGNVSDGGTYLLKVTAKQDPAGTVKVDGDAVSAEFKVEVKITPLANTLEYDPNGGTGGPVNNFSNGITLTVQSSQPNREGYSFTGWNTAADGSGDAYNGGQSYTFADSTNNNGNGGMKTVLYAQWKANSYTLSFDPAGGSAADSKTVTYDAALGELPVSTREGYSFLGWYDANGNKLSADSLYKLAGSGVATARWQALEYTITFDYNGAEKGVETMKVVYGEPIGALPYPSNGNKIFAGWYDAEYQPVRAGDIYDIAGDSTLKAGWVDPASAPKTGDDSGLAFWLGLMTASALLAGGAVLKLRKGKQN